MKKFKDGLSCLRIYYLLNYIKKQNVRHDSGLFKIYWRNRDLVFLKKQYLPARVLIESALYTDSHMTKVCVTAVCNV